MNRNEAARPPPAVPAVPAVPAASANQNPKPAPPHRCSPRHNPELGHAHAIKSQPPARQPHSAPKSRTANRPEMARTYPLSPLATMTPWDQKKILSLLLAYAWWISVTVTASNLSRLKQLRDALSKTLDPDSRFALRGHIARPGQNSAFATP